MNIGQYMPFIAHFHAGCALIVQRGIIAEIMQS
jgi:hypothetical protein